MVDKWFKHKHVCVWNTVFNKVYVQCFMKKTEPSCKVTRDTNGNHVQEVEGKKIIGTGGNLLFCHIWGKTELVSVLIFAVSASVFKRNLPWVSPQFIQLKRKGGGGKL